MTALLPVVALVPFWLLAMVVVWLPLRAVTDLPYWLVPAGWLALGAVLLVPPAQVALLSAFLGARRPGPHEVAVIAPIWRDLALTAEQIGQDHKALGLSKHAQLLNRRIGDRAGLMYRRHRSAFN